MRRRGPHPRARGGAGGGAGPVTSDTRVAPAAQEQLVPREAASERASGRAWGAGGRLGHAAGAAAATAAALHHCTMSGQLERCEREWHELEGEFQELQVGPGHLVPQLLLLPAVRCLPHRATPAPGWGDRTQRVAQAVRPMSWWVAWRSPLLIFQRLGSSASWGARSKPPILPPSHPLFAPRSPSAAESWSLAPPRVSSRCVHEEIVPRSKDTRPAPTQGSPLNFATLRLPPGSPTTGSLLVGQPFPAAAL